MTNNHDFKAALEAVKGGYDPDRFGDFCASNKHFGTIQTALRIADRLQRGEVSDEMLEKGNYQLLKNRNEFSLTSPNVFKAMSAQMIKEESEE